jgi:phosphatidylglycerol:prolipoprotein diacylglycerol transferase
MKPILFSLFGEAVYSYPLLVGASWGLGYSLAKSNWSAQLGDEKKFNIIFVGAFISAWIGAKVFFLLFSMPAEQMKFAKEVSFWLGGGFVFYGGLVFALLFMLIAMKLLSIKVIKMAVLIPPLFIGHALGRVGCFLAGCCFGKQCSLEFIDHHPVQLYEAASLLALYFISNYFLNKRKSYELTLLSYLWGYSLVRFILELFRDDKVRGIHFGLSTSQWTSLALFLLGSVFFTFIWSRKGKTF